MIDKTYGPIGWLPPHVNRPLAGVMDTAQATGLAIENDVLAAQAGDPQAFTRLVSTTCALVSSIALAIVRDPDLSRDVAQDVFLSTWRDIARLRDPGSFLPWLRQVTRHRAYHILRGLRRGRRRIVDSQADELLAAAADPRPDAHQRLTSIETRRLVAEVIDHLPTDAREVVTLYYREERSVTQVAGLLGLSEAAVRQRLSRARARLRDDLLDRAGQELAATVPGPAFVAAIAHALTVGAPAASAATTTGIAAAKTGWLSAEKGLAAKLLLSGPALAGALAGAAGFLFATRHLPREARDDRERIDVRRFRGIASVITIAAALAFRLGFAATHWRGWPVMWFGLFIAALAALLHVWLPRILRRRFEAEMREDPARALARRSRERRGAMLGWALGLTFGMLGLALGMWFASHGTPPIR